MSLKNKLDELRLNKQKLGKYRKAIRTLEDIGVEDILGALSLPDDVDVRHDKGTELAAAACHQSLGYQQCLRDLFGLEELVVGSQERLVADFGANDKLGLSESEAKKLL